MYLQHRVSSVVLVSTSSEYILTSGCPEFHTTTYMLQVQYIHMHKHSNEMGTELTTNFKFFIIFY